MAGASPIPLNPVPCLPCVYVTHKALLHFLTKQLYKLLTCAGQLLIANKSRAPYPESTVVSQSVSAVDLLQQQLQPIPVPRNYCVENFAALVVFQIKLGTLITIAGYSTTTTFQSLSRLVLSVTHTHDESLVCFQLPDINNN